MLAQSPVGLVEQGDDLVVLGVGDMPEPVLPIGPAGEPDAHLVHIQAHPSGGLVDSGAVRERLCDVHPPAGEHPLPGRSASGDAGGYLDHHQPAIGDIDDGQVGDDPVDAPSSGQLQRALHEFWNPTRGRLLLVTGLISSVATFRCCGHNGIVTP
jgi:hypothetical protein